LTQLGQSVQIRLISSWNSIFIRDDFGDAGQIPSGVRSASHSPDIIPAGSSKLTNKNDDSAQQILVDDWALDIGGDVTASALNYFYVRGMNRGGPDQTGQFNLYYALGGTLIDPMNWRPILAADGSPAVAVDLWPTGGFAVPAQAFVWTNPVSPPPNAHYCLIATYSNPPLVPDPRPAEAFTTPDAYVLWVVNNPNVAWRNINIVTAPAQTDSESWGIATDDPVNPRTYLLNLYCSGMPPGTTITLKCDDPGPSPQINKGGMTIAGEDFSLSAQTTLPPNWAGAVVATAQAPEGQFITGSMKLDQVLLRDELTDPSILHLMKPVPPHMQPAESRALSDLTAVLVGECTTYYAAGAAFRVPARAPIPGWV
jgi:hypothetical protein